MSYLVYELRFDPAIVDDDELVALLSLAGFEGFEQTEGILDAYLPEDRVEEATSWLKSIQQTHDFTYTVAPLPDKNWNAEWEANFSPIQIGDWLGIRAGFHEPMDGLEMEIIIDPKMAFGTGHHATTHMVCDLMKEESWAGKSVFDYGCGTGILSIVAKKLGAAYVAAIDIETASYENTLENAETNGVELDRVFCGDLEAFDLDGLKAKEILGQDDVADDMAEGVHLAEVQKKKTAPAAVTKRLEESETLLMYDYILANINRGVILESLEPLKNRLLPGGKLFVSGILKSDAALVLEAADATGFRSVVEQQREDWMAWVFELR
ncbi:MAG: 50S ribosomal protein L11 methyltransferase [Bacteroidota bacterium]